MEVSESVNKYRTLVAAHLVHYVQHAIAYYIHGAKRYVPAHMVRMEADMMLYLYLEAAFQDTGRAVGTFDLDIYKTTDGQSSFVVDDVKFNVLFQQVTEALQEWCGQDRHVNENFFAHLKKIHGVTP